MEQGYRQRSPFDSINSASTTFAKIFAELQNQKIPKKNSKILLSIFDFVYQKKIDFGNSWNTKLVKSTKVYS